MKRVSLIPYFSLAFFYHLSMPYFNTLFPFLYFAPFFSTCYSRCSLFQCLWISFFIGLFFDLCSTSTPMGFYPLCTIMTTILLHRYKRFFLEDKLLPFSLYTGIYSFSYTLIFTFLHSFFDTKLKVHFLSFLVDVTLLPVIDICYHLLFFSLPISIYIFLSAREQKVFFLRIKKRLASNIPNLKRIFSR